jgi:Kef-type K+ transport system membrane component KefB
MGSLKTEELLIVIAGLVVLSYLFSILSRLIRVPSVLLLLFAGIAFRAVSSSYGVNVNFSDQLIESLGVVGLIMIMLEAGLDLKLGKDKLRLIRNSFLSALVIFVLSAVSVCFLLHWWLGEPINNCIVYAIPLAIMSSTIIIPSLHPLTKERKEFLVYEASFSDILGVLAFNYFIAGDSGSAVSMGKFTVNILLSVLLSVILSWLLFMILARTKLTIKFFLIFALLILIYTGGKLLHLPSLLIILAFGLFINNWEKLPAVKWIRQYPSEQVESLRGFLHSITAETSFLVRTFFFLLFGYSISLNFLSEQEVWLVGGSIVVILFIIRMFYFRFFVRSAVFPEAFFIPRGLVTIVLFYKIPASMKLGSFNDGILFFIIVATGLLMAIAMLLYRKKPEELVEQGAFSEQPTNI